MRASKFKSNYASIAICNARTVAPVAAIARSPCPTRIKMLDSLLMCLLRLTVRSNSQQDAPLADSQQTHYLTNR